MGDHFLMLIIYKKEKKKEREGKGKENSIWNLYLHKHKTSSRRMMWINSSDWPV